MNSIDSNIPQRSSEEIIALRQRHLNPSLSTSYRSPIKMVRGAGAHLYDEQGKAYLDMVNNVCHVGHCHPSVVSAGQAQMAQLNTNTRYLHDNIVEYAQRLSATFPSELSVIFLTNSGTEANDLALRLARNYTQAQNIIVVDHAYHGNSPSMIELSPYKFDGKGGQGKPPHVQVATIPNPYRGAYRHDDPDCGELYAQDVQRATLAIQEKGEKPAAFFCESILGCGGQVVLPPGYLKAAYAHARAAGAVCISDEVQVGFGRAGTHFWAFQMQQVIPDIVTMGKPICNGHPMGAVVTRPEIAQAFMNGMEYFNTFAGNPVSCAMGLAVLDVIEKEGLQANARLVGDYLLKHLRLLQQRFPIIGEVRGTGLFIGIEFISDQVTLQPATKEAKAAIEYMKELGVLLSTDGPYDNVIKIKPPLVFTLENAKEFLSHFEATLHYLLQSQS
ncbi:MAG: aminotransferase class III-fold pyridoxal phosphate-dependent enzyme [Undibacterium sp.]|nr:aminotransferase class III-fold pyridoxal phosphate-dependent enzyme [Undibacterium sp.]